MKTYVDQMSVVFELNLELAGDDVIDQVMNGFKEILKNDLRVAEIVCNSQMKWFVFSNDKEKKEKFYCAEYVINESIKSPYVVLVSANLHEESMKLISTQQF